MSTKKEVMETEGAGWSAPWTEAVLVLDTLRFHELYSLFMFKRYQSHFLLYDILHHYK